MYIRKPALTNVGIIKRRNAQERRFDMKKNEEIMMFCLFIAALTLGSISSLAIYDNINKSTKLTTNQLNGIQQGIDDIKVILTSGCQEVTLSAYHPKSRGINSDKNPNKTALMKKPIAGYTLAISNELFELGWLGKKIYIDGWGVGKATDRMSHTVKGKQIDICAPSLKVAKNFGIKNDVMAVILN